VELREGAAYHSKVCMNGRKEIFACDVGECRELGESREKASLRWKSRTRLSLHGARHSEQLVI
jgi:hypothetical protein